MKPLTRKASRRNRNVITALLISAASLVLVVYVLEIPYEELLSVFLGTLLFVFIIIVLAVAAIALIKGLGRLLRKFR